MPEAAGGRAATGVDGLDEVLCGGLAIYNYYPGRFALPVLAGAAIVGHVAMGVGWLLWAFLVLVAAGLGAQIWFVLGWMRAVKREEGASS